MDYLAIFSSFMTLVFVIAIFFGAHYVSKMVAGNYQKNLHYNKNIVEIIERKPLSKDQFLIVVKASDKIILLGATPHQINEIATFDSLEFASFEIEQTEENLKDNNFKDIFEKYTKKK